MSRECSINLNCVVSIVFERSKINQSLECHKRVLRKYVFFGEKTIERYWLDEYYGNHIEYNEQDILKHEEYMLIGDTVFFKPSIKIISNGGHELVYYFADDIIAEKTYNDIIREMNNKIPLFNVKYDNT